MFYYFLNIHTVFQIINFYNKFFYFNIRFFKKVLLITSILFFQVFIILILILVLKPDGILGKNQPFIGSIP